ncbi:unnamed protein product, partial [Oppiella nova]
MNMLLNIHMILDHAKLFLLGTLRICGHKTPTATILRWRPWTHNFTGYFTYLWSQNADRYDPKVETLDTQFQYIADRPDVYLPFQSGDETWCMNMTQHPQQYGDLSIAKKGTVSQFMGPNFKSKFDTDNKQDIILEKCNLTIDQDIHVFLAQKRIDLTVDTIEKQRYQDQLDGLTRGREYVDKVLYEYVNSILKSKFDTDNKQDI